MIIRIKIGKFRFNELSTNNKFVSLKTRIASTKIFRIKARNNLSHAKPQILLQFSLALLSKFMSKLCFVRLSVVWEQREI